MFLKLWLSKKIATIELVRRKRRCQEIVRTKASDPLFKQRLNSNDKYRFPDYGFSILITRWSMLIRSVDTQQTIRCIIILKKTYCSLEQNSFFSIARNVPRNVSYLIYFFLPLSFYKLQRFITRIIARYYIIQTIPVFRFPSVSSADKPYRDFPPTFHRPTLKRIAYSVAVHEQQVAAKARHAFLIFRTNSSMINSRVAKNPARRYSSFESKHES